MFSDEIQSLAQRVVGVCREKRWMMATAESCTGGLIAAAITSVPGASAVLDRGLVTYSNSAKQVLLGLSTGLLEEHGSVSEEAARAMAAGVLTGSLAKLSVATTGIAGPTGGSAYKPVGLVHFACVSPSGVAHHEARYGDLGREAIQLASTTTALQMLLTAAEAG